MTARLRRLSVGVLCLGPSLLAGCGGLSAPTAVSNTQAKLRHDIQMLAAAAAAHDMPTARAALGTLNGDLAQAQSIAVLTAAQLAQLRSAASAVAIDLAPPTPLPSTVISRATVTPTAPVRATTPIPKHDKRSGNGNGNGKGDGGGGD
ncbi:MAG: hypothetical protein M3O28_01560 [Actinomycetota bacterium]|nr:hypothetical protein [Actinomycetota bacterium]